jgi:hypothetical protein
VWEYVHVYEYVGGKQKEPIAAKEEKNQAINIYSHHMHVCM